MFKYFVVSIVFVPVLFGLMAAALPDRAAGGRSLRRRWLWFAVFWIGLLHFLRYRWQ